VKLLFSIIGIFLGAVVSSDWEGAAFGLVIGYLFGAHIQLRGSVIDLQRELKAIKSNLIDSQVNIEKAVADDNLVDSEAETVSRTQAEQHGEIDSEAPTVVGAAKHQEDDTEMPTIIPPERSTIFEDNDEPIELDLEIRSADEVGQSTSLLDKAIDYVKHFFTTGNVVVKIGVIILFFGVGFLIDALNLQMPRIEYRLIGIGMGAIVMLVFGWRLRESRAGYALVLQGGAVGIMYITIFAAAKNYQLIEPLSALVMMVLLVSFSAILAYAQDSRSLAIFGSAGGFVAPILTSTGSGSHIMLFSYYALLNTGIFGMAWVKSWRSLNLVGFVFTFVIGAAWGIKYYQPHYFDSTEPFLILFFLFYIAIAVLFAHRQPPQLKGVVDGTLVFGVPLVAFTLQAALVRDFEFGRALSALGIAAIYIGLAKLLWHKQVEGMRLLTESFLALGVIFASLAIPYALDGRWTAATWSLEGAAAVWLGIRQNRLLTRNFGLLLQIGASLMFLSTLREPLGSIPILNSAYIGCLFTSLAGLFTAYYHYQHQDELRDWEKTFHFFLLAWGVAWWLGAGVMEIDHHLSYRFELNASLFFFALSFLVLDRIARRWRWAPATLASIFLLPAIIFSVFIAYVDHSSTHPLSNYGYISWTIAFAGQYLLLYRNESEWPEGVISKWHLGTLWIFVFMLAWIVADSVNALVIGSHIWGDVFWGLIPALIILLLVQHHQKLTWPVLAYKENYLQTGLFPLLIVTSLWLLVSCFVEGRPRPLNYVPIANPLELTQLFILFVFFIWIWQCKRDKIPPSPFLQPPTLLYTAGGLAFVWLNAVVGRAVHFFYGVRFNPDALFDSAVYQASISIVWTLAALTMTFLATRYSNRKIWFVGAALIAAVAVKLFVIDLKDSDTVERIVSFLTVGILLSVIGYLSPLPPKENREQDSIEDND
jgi:uncharacterized membrane protein